jgi:hypothetical protein
MKRIAIVFALMLACFGGYAYAKPSGQGVVFFEPMPGMAGIYRFQDVAEGVVVNCYLARSFVTSDPVSLSCVQVVPMGKK